MVRQDADTAPVTNSVRVIIFFVLAHFFAMPRSEHFAAQLENDPREGDAGGGVPAADAPSDGALLHSPT